MPRKLAGFMLAVCIPIAPGLAQTSTELLQKGIFAQETEGNLDTAILIYRQIVNSAPAQRDLAAQAQFRLGQALLQKGDLTSAAQEFDKLARDYSEYRNLVSSLSGPNGKQRAVARMATNVFLVNQGPGAIEFDENRPVRVVGRVVRIILLNPEGRIVVEDGASRYLFVTAAATDMIKQQGFTKGTLKLGDTVEVRGVLSVGAQEVDGATAARADSISIDGKVVFDRATLKATAIDQAEADLRKQEAVQIMKELAALKNDLNVMRGQFGDNSPEVIAQKNRIADVQRLATRMMERDEGK